MRLLLLLVPALAGAEFGSTPTSVAGSGWHDPGRGAAGRDREIGAGAMWFGERWGVGIVVDRIARANAKLAIAREHRFDVVLAFRGGGHVGGVARVFASSTGGRD